MQTVGLHLAAAVVQTGQTVNAHLNEIAAIAAFDDAQSGLVGVDVQILTHIVHRRFVRLVGLVGLGGLLRSPRRLRCRLGGGLGRLRGLGGSRILFAGAGREREKHDQRQQQAQIFFHLQHLTFNSICGKPRALRRGRDNKSAG